MENKYTDLQTAFEETEKYYIEQLESVETFKSYQGRLLTSVSLIIATFGFVINQINEDIDISPFFVIVIGALFMIYIAIYSYIVMPISLEWPILIEKENLKSLFEGKEEKQIFETKLDNYLDAVEMTRSKVKSFKCLAYFSALIYLAILISTFIVFCKII